MCDSFGFHRNEHFTRFLYHLLPSNLGVRMAFVSLCLFIPAGCVSQSPAKLTIQKNISIDSFRIVKASPESVDIELVGSNDGSMGQLCLGVIAKSKDGIVSSVEIQPYTFPVGKKLHIVERVPRPPGLEQLQTDSLAVIVYPCGKQGVILSRIFDWPYTWPLQAASSSSEQAAVQTDTHSWRVFFQNLNELDFASLDVLSKKWNNPKERDRNGEWKLDSFRSALNYLWNNKDWHGNLVRIQQWRKFNPKSSSAAIAEAKYWSAYAWHIRGNLDNTNVDPVAMKVFDERMKKAEQILDDSKAFASNNPLWYETYLDIAVDENRDEEFIAQLFEEGIRKFPYFQPLYIDMASFWSPWSGINADWRKVDELVNQAVSLTKIYDGTINYAMLYAQIFDAQKLEFDPFRDSMVSWPTMRESFEELVKRYPSDNNLNEFAAYACRADDKKAYLAIRPKIQGHIVPDKWRSNYSIDLCDHRFMQYS